MSIEVSVVVSTYNRSTFLKDLLLSLLSQDYPKELYEIIVVDNNSKDNTASVVSEINQKYKIIYLKELNQGLSFSRNTGAKFAKGRILAFIDDDALADKHWISGIMQVYNAYPDALCVGGKIDPVYEGGKPDWPSSNYWEGFYGKLDYGTEIKQLRYPDCIVGANFSTKRDIFFELEGFDTQLGRNSRSLLSAEEIHYCSKIFRAGGKIYYSPSAMVYHKIAKERINLDFLYKRFYWQGISEAIMEQSFKKFNRFAIFKNLLFHLKDFFQQLFDAFLFNITHEGINIRGRYFLLNNLGKIRQDIMFLLSGSRIK